MIAKIFGRSRRHESEPESSPQFPNEHFLVKATAHDDRGQPFYVHFYYDLTGYKLDDKPLLCHDCEADTKEIAVIRAEIYSGTMEPQGSEFYGPSHIPSQALAETNVLLKVK